MADSEDVEKLSSIVLSASNRRMREMSHEVVVGNAKEDPAKPKCKWEVEADACDKCKKRGEFLFDPEETPTDTHSGCKCHPDAIFLKDPTDAEARLIKLCIEDVSGKRSKERCDNIVSLMDNCLGRAFAEFKPLKSERAFNDTVNNLLARIGNVYGIRISAEYAAKGSGRYCPTPAGEEVFAVCRVASKHREAVFLSLDETSGVLNVDLMIDGRYVDVKSPQGISKLGKRFNHAAKQCQAHGQEKGDVILSDLNYAGDFSLAEAKGREFIESGTLGSVTIVRVLGSTYDL